MLLPPNGLGPADSIVALNEVSDTTAQRFISLNKGRAAISSSVSVSASGPTSGEKTSFAVLSDPGAVMYMLMELLKASHTSRQSRPPLVENLLELMGGLRAAVGGTGGPA